MKAIHSTELYIAIEEAYMSLGMDMGVRTHENMCGYILELPGISMVCNPYTPSDLSNGLALDYNTSMAVVSTLDPKAITVLSHRIVATFNETLFTGFDLSAIKLIGTKI